MNLDDSAKVAREIEERNRKKRLVITSILLCMVLMAGLGILIFFIVLKDNNTLKIYVNNVQRAIPATLFVDDNGVKYVNVNNMSSLLGVTYTRGKYQVYDEDENSCYLTSLHEVVALTAGEKTYSKFLVDEADSQLKQERMQDEIKVYGQLLTISSEQGTEEVHTLKYPIQANKNGIYVAFDDLSTRFNLSALKTATKLGYPVPSYSYENMRGLIDYYFVAGESSSRVGVINTRTSSVVISCTYDRIIY